MLNVAEISSLYTEMLEGLVKCQKCRELVHPDDTINGICEYCQQDDEFEDIYFGYVMGDEDEWGDFSTSELKENGIKFYTEPKDLQAIMPPQGWTKKERDNNGN